MKILAYHGTGLLSWWIRTRTWSEISHVSQLLDDGTEVEAWSGGVQHNKTWGILHKDGTVVDVYDYREPLTAVQKLKMESFLLDQVGKPYDYFGLFRFLPIVRWFARSSNEVKAWFCSELVMESNEVSGIDLLEKEAYQTTPNDVVVSPLLRKEDTWVVGKPLNASRRLDLSLPIPSTLLA
jgi:Orthopoxvirus protein of unknown function (DUF830).